MKKTIPLLFSVFGFLFTLQVNAQNTLTQIDGRLIAMYGQAQITQMQNDQPQTLAYLNYYVQHGYQVLTDVPAYKLAHFPDISTITYKATQKPLAPTDIENLNILLLDIKRENDQYLTYKIGDTGLVIVFIAPKNLLAEYKQSLK